MIVRRYRPDDALALAEVFHHAVHVTAARDYGPSQLDAWSSAPLPDRFADREADGRIVWVAEDAARVVGFIELEPNGHIDCFYCHPRGAGTALYDALEAGARGMEQLFVDASKTARPFFERRGFEVIEAQNVDRGGVTLMNFRMEKRQAPPAPRR
ncbi:MAG TPA: GNAT family N-acetyltransferase [Maritimibacter sp.]|nr:GNAT family N-acetyltransferase [Maritimibacter sp.]